MTAPALAVRLPSLAERRLDHHDRARARYCGGTFQREASNTERAFLARTYGPVPFTGLHTRVEVTGGLRRRTWPQLNSRQKRNPFDTDDAA